MAAAKNLSRQTAIYTIGNFIYRAAAFALIPLYVRTLPASAYGTLEMITTTMVIIQSVLASGVAHSAMRFYYDYKEPRQSRSVISTALIASFLFASLGAGLCILAAPVLSHLVFHTDLYALAFRIACVSLVFEISREINLAFVRARGQSTLFITMSVVQLVAQVVSSTLAVVYWKLGVVGILSANLLATFCVWLVLTTYTVSQCGLHFDRKLLRPLAHYGYPIMLSGLSASIFQTCDRYFLSSAVSLQALGIYALAMRIANMIPVLVVTPFTNSYGPYRLSIMGDADAPAQYVKVARLYLVVASFLMLGIAAFSREAVRWMASPDYWPAARIVPLLLIPGTLGGLNYCLQTSIYIQKQTKHLFYIALVSGAINLVGLAVLVPRYGTIGAGSAAVVAYLYTLAHTWVAARRALPVPYELGRLARIFGVACVLMALAVQLQIENIREAILLKLVFLACYPMILMLLGDLPFSMRQLRRLAWKQPALKQRADGAAV